MDFHLGIYLCRKMGDTDLCDETLVDSKWKTCAVLNDCLLTTSLPQDLCAFKRNHPNQSKLKISACKPEVQQTGMTFGYETCQKCQVGYVLACHSLKKHFCLFSLLFKWNFQNHPLIFRKCQFSKFCEKFKCPTIQNVLLFFCYCHDSDHMYNVD